MHDLRLPARQTKYDYIQLEGGLDLLTPTLQLKSGAVRDALHWEQSISGGYSRIGGYERFDGRPAPSLGTYGTVTVAVASAPAAGQTIVGQTSGATGVVLSLTQQLPANPVVAYSKSTGSFVIGEALKVGATTTGTVSMLGGLGSAPDYDVTQISLAANLYRADIQAVPGSGPVRGVEVLAGTTYAWRDNVGATALTIWKATAGGWVSVPLLFELPFHLGTAQYIAGQTVSQGGVHATVMAVALEVGDLSTWGAGTAQGRLIISAPIGGNFAAGVIAGGGGATATGAQTAITLLPGGRVETDKHNFGLGQMIYGVDGRNRGFQFDGVTMAPINSGNTPDTPQHVVTHKDHLFFSFGSNVQNSGITTPFNWTAVAGSLAYRVDGVVTNMVRQAGDQSTGALIITTVSNSNVLYGKSAADFQLDPFEESAGARAYSAQRVGNLAMFFSNLGVFSMSSTQSFGNFTPASMTLKIRPFTQPRKGQVTASVVNREKSQYRTFFADGSALFMTIANGRVLGSMPMQFPDVVSCACQSEDDDAVEKGFVGTAGGFVMRMDAGTSFDGAAIDAYYTLTYASQGNSRIYKRYTGVSFEVQGTGFATFNVTSSLSYGDIFRPQGGTPLTTSIDLKALFWDAFVWDTFVWDGTNLGPSDVELRGTGTNLALRVDCSSDKFPPFTHNSAILHYVPRKGKKK